MAILSKLCRSGALISPRIGHPNSDGGWLSSVPRGDQNSQKVGHGIACQLRALIIY